MDANTLRLTVGGTAGVPSSARAVAIGIAYIRPPVNGWMTVWPAGVPRPLVANVNTMAGGVVQTMAIVTLGTNGSIDIYQSQPGTFVVDLLGSFEPATTAVAAGRFVPLNPGRILDTRFSGIVPPNGTTACDTAAWVPGHASAVVLGLSSVASGRSYLTAHQEGVARPFVSHLNFDQPGQVRGSQVIVPLPNPTRRVNVYTSGGGHVLADIVGYITGPSSPVSTDGLFVPAIVPSRQLDTRTIPWLAYMAPNWVAEAAVPTGVTAAAAAWNVALVNTQQPGWMTAYPTRIPRPPVGQVYSTFPGTVASSHAWVRVSQAGIALSPTSGGAVVADYAGYFTGTPLTVQQARPVNSPAVFPAPPYTLSIPRLGLTMAVDTGSISLPDYGIGWIWPGSVLPGQQGSISVFAHRTDAGGVFRYINALRPGDEMTLIAANGKRYVFRMTQSAITGSSEASILGAVWATPLPSLSLIACSKTDGTPTSLKYRLVVSGVLEFQIIP